MSIWEITFQASLLPSSYISPSRSPSAISLYPAIISNNKNHLANETTTTRMCKSLITTFSCNHTTTTSIPCPARCERSQTIIGSAGDLDCPDCFLSAVMGNGSVQGTEESREDYEDLGEIGALHKGGGRKRNREGEGSGDGGRLVRTIPPRAE